MAEVTARAPPGSNIHSRALAEGQGRVSEAFRGSQSLALPYGGPPPYAGSQVGGPPPNFVGPPPNLGGPPPDFGAPPPNFGGPRPNFGNGYGAAPSFSGPGSRPPPFNGRYPNGGPPPYSGAQNMGPPPPQQQQQQGYGRPLPQDTLQWDDSAPPTEEFGTYTQKTQGPSQGPPQGQSPRFQPQKTTWKQDAGYGYGPPPGGFPPSGPPPTNFAADRSRAPPTNPAVPVQQAPSHQPGHEVEASCPSLQAPWGPLSWPVPQCRPAAKHIREGPPWESCPAGPSLQAARREQGLGLRPRQHSLPRRQKRWAYVQGLTFPAGPC